MLFNTGWNKSTEEQPKLDVMSTASLVAWLKKQPAIAAYDYYNPNSCLLAQYFRENGHPEAMLGTSYVHDLDGKRTVALPSAFFAAATHQPHTYGGALKRAKAYL